MPTDPFQQAQLSAVEARNKCKLCPQVRELQPLQIKQFFDALNNPEIFHGVITSVLNDWGIETTETTVGNHRRGHHPRCMAQLAKIVKAIK
jgi:hypothetical protein